MHRRVHEAQNARKAGHLAVVLIVIVIVLVWINATLLLITT